MFSLGSLKAVLPEIGKELRKRLGEKFTLEFTLRDMSVPKRVAIFASKSDHCLLDLLWRHRHGELPLVVSMVISNHPDAATEVTNLGVPIINIHTRSCRPEDLDEGPIIEQDVIRVTHAGTVADLQRRGADVERIVLSRAVKWHSEDRVICNGNHTIVFT